MLEVLGVFDENEKLAKDAEQNGNNDGAYYYYRSAIPYFESYAEVKKTN
jgi:hypothetical protein